MLPLTATTQLVVGAGVDSRAKSASVAKTVTVGSKGVLEVSVSTETASGVVRGISSPLSAFRRWALHIDVTHCVIGSLFSIFTVVHVTPPLGAGSRDNEYVTDTKHPGHVVTGVGG